MAITIDADTNLNSLILPEFSVSIIHQSTGAAETYTITNIGDEDAYVVTFDRDNRTDPDKVEKMHLTAKGGNGVFTAQVILAIATGGNGTILNVT